ncbi:MAG: flagellar assembly protein FliX [Rhodospirillales bacterium]|nr:flagellar assembly protein FliX [Rhodospirillales bacterium]
MADMKVGNVGAGRGPTATRKNRKTSESGSAFSETLREAADTGGAEGASGVVGVAPVGGILSVQEVGDATDGRSRGLVIDYGDDLLDRLEEIRLGLLLGTISKDRLAELAQRMRQQRLESDDPTLTQIFDEIELRSEVEIAKLTRDI